MNRPSGLALSLLLALSLTGAPAAAASSSSSAAPARRALPQDPAQKQPGQGGRKNPPPGARGFEQFAGRDAADKLIKGAATRRYAPAMPGALKRNPPPPSRLETLVREAERERAAKNYEAAVAAYRKAIELRRAAPASDDGELQYALGKIYSEMERYEEAAAEFRYASTRRASGDTAPYATYELGNAYLDLGKYAEALTAYDETLKILTGEWKKSRPALSAQYLPYPHFNRGLAYLGLKQLEEAVAAFETATRLKPDFPEAHFNLGLVLWQSGRQDAARATLASLRAIDAGLAGRLAALFK